MKKLTLTLYIFYCLLLSCSTNEHICSNSTNTHRLTLVDSTILPLDSISTAMSEGLFYFTQSGQKLLAKSNFNNWKIDIYNLNSLQIHKSIPIYKEGPNGVGQIPSGYHFHNMDSIFLFFNLEQTLKLISSTGKLLDFYDLNEVRLPIIDIKSYRPAFIVNEKIHLSTYDNSYDNHSKSGAILNLKTGDLSHPYSNPVLYNSGYWQGILYDNFTNIKDEEGNVINSYGADHHIYKVNTEGQITSYCAKSKFLDPDIKPYSNSTVDFGEHAQKIYKFETLQGGYGYMLYDKFRKIYYRFVLTPTSSSDFKSPQQLFMKPAVIVLDKNLNKIGETLLPKGHKHTQAFIDERGLNILNFSDSERNENRALYSTFKIEKI